MTCALAFIAGVLVGLAFAAGLWVACAIVRG